MNHYAYTPIPTDPVFLSLNGCKNWGTLHQRIRKAFGFPDYYGENWDAMWDCLTDVFLRPVQRHIVVEGFASMPQELLKLLYWHSFVYRHCRKRSPEFMRVYLI